MPIKLKGGGLFTKPKALSENVLHPTSNFQTWNVHKLCMVESSHCCVQEEQ